MTDSAARWRGLQVKDLILTALTCRYDVSVYLSSLQSGESNFFLQLNSFRAVKGTCCVRAQSSPVAAQAPARHLQGLTQGEHRFSFAFVCTVLPNVALKVQCWC